MCADVWMSVFRIDKTIMIEAMDFATISTIRAESVWAGLRNSKYHSRWSVKDKIQKGAR